MNVSADVEDTKKSHIKLLVIKTTMSNMKKNALDEIDSGLSSV